MFRGFAYVFILFMFVTSLYMSCLRVSQGSRVIIVPDDYVNLADAVQAAVPGDVIYLRAGRHILGDKTLVVNKTLSIIGESPLTTIIVGPGYGHELLPLAASGVEVKPKYALLSLWVTPVNLIPIPKAALEVYANNFKISNLTIERCDIGVVVKGDGTVIMNTIMPSATITGSNSVIEDNIIWSLSVSGNYNFVMQNHGRVSFSGSYSLIAMNNGSDLNLQGSFNIVAGNIFSIISMENAHSNMVCNNSLRCIWLGMYGHACSNNTVCKNKLTGPYIWGILMGTGSHNVFHDNLISNYRMEYSGYGVAIGGYGQIAEYNIFFRNIFMNNNRHVSTNWEVKGAGNLWDNGKVGNYWDDYEGVDADGDGIGDTPYIVKGVVYSDATGRHVSFIFGVDNYPLISPPNIASTPIEWPEWAIPILKLALKAKSNLPIVNVPLLEQNSTQQTQLWSPESKYSMIWAAAIGGSAVIAAAIALKFRKSKRDYKDV